MKIVCFTNLKGKKVFLAFHSHGAYCGHVLKDSSAKPYVKHSLLLLVDTSRPYLTVDEDQMTNLFKMQHVQVCAWSSDDVNGGHAYHRFKHVVLCSLNTKQLKN